MHLRRVLGLSLIPITFACTPPSGDDGTDAFTFTFTGDGDGDTETGTGDGDGDGDGDG